MSSCQDITITLAQAATLNLSASAFPLVHLTWQKAIVIIAAYWIGLRFSGPIVLHFVTPPASAGGKRLDPSEHGGLDRALLRAYNGFKPKPRYDAGAIIGKCENILTITLVLAGQFGGLGLVFTGKALARSDDIKTNASWFLGGTLINLVWGLLVGMLARLIAIGV